MVKTRHCERKGLSSKERCPMSTSLTGVCGRLQVSAETGSVTSYAQLADAVVKVASGLWRQGTRQGDVVTLFSTNCEQFAVAYLALSAVGAVVSTLNPSYTSGTTKRLQRGRTFDQSLLIISPVTEFCHLAIGD